MGAIKDIVDLTKDLESRAKERRDIELIHKLQSLAFSLQSQQAEIVERDVLLMKENSDLRDQLAKAHAEEVRIYLGMEFRRGKRTGFKWVAFCPKCHLPASNPGDGLFVVCSDGGCKWNARLTTPGLANALRDVEAAVAAG
jgi:hypothetical protein